MPRLMLDCLVKQSQDKKTQLEVLVNLLHYLPAQLRCNLRNSSRMYGPLRGALGSVPSVPSVPDPLDVQYRSLLRQ